MSVGTLRLGSFLLLVVLEGVYVVGRQRAYLEAGIFSSSGGLVRPLFFCSRPGIRGMEKKKGLTRPPEEEKTPASRYAR